MMEIIKAKNRMIASLLIMKTKKINSSETLKETLPTEIGPSPTGQLTFPTEILLSPTGQPTFPTEIVSSPTGQLSFPTEILSSPTGRQPSNFGRLTSLFKNKTPNLLIIRTVLYNNSLLMFTNLLKNHE
jgi:hypothetical protein